MLLVVALATALALVTVGGGLYEFLVVDPFWPKRPDLIQPSRGGISRRRFWIAAHVAFEVLLIASLVWAWSEPAVRSCLLVALASHAIMRLWSALDFIPKALAFERAEPGTVSEAAALDATQPAPPAARPRDVRRCAVGAGIGRTARIIQPQAIQIIGGFAANYRLTGDCPMLIFRPL
jgi:hypothetical protein